MKEQLIWLNGNDGTSFLALGCQDELVQWEVEKAWSKAKSFLDKYKSDFVFGWFGYDLKNDIEKLQSENPSWVETPCNYLLVPKHLAKIEGNHLQVIKGDGEKLKEKLGQLKSTQGRTKADIEIKPSISEEVYLGKVRKIKEHIQLGDIYEANFCYEFQGSGDFDPLAVYQKLNERTKAPFSAYVELDKLNILSASPERFVQKIGDRIITQPIKGTIRRGVSQEEDKTLIEKLRTNPKDRAENIMIVDLVRNDLSKIAKPSSVVVDELCEIYTFENIHQMISTVSAKVGQDHPIDILKALFPMGSMTGAPKVRAMELIEEYETSKRGLYSGCIGYFTPEGGFDFNVVIRTIVYSPEEKRFCFSVGGAITDLSTPDGEYEETLLKAKALIESLNE